MLGMGQQCRATLAYVYIPSVEVVCADVAAITAAEIFTGFGRSVCRVVWERPLVLSGTSHRRLIQCGVHLSSGAHHSILKEDRFCSR